jgi:hypothetical protein
MKSPIDHLHFNDLNSNSYSFIMNFIYTDKEKKFIKYYEDFLNFTTNTEHSLNIYDVASELTVTTTFLRNKNKNLLNDFIQQLDNENLTTNLENILTVYNYSIPNTKLHYPEPFIASASFMHSDI